MFRDELVDWNGLTRHSMTFACLAKNEAWYIYKLDESPLFTSSHTISIHNSIMSTEPGHSNENHLKADGTPDHRFKEVRPPTIL